MDLRKLLNAMYCAVAVLEGTAGGYTPEQRMEAKLTLMQWLALISKTLRDTTSNDGTIVRR